MGNYPRWLSVLCLAVLVVASPAALNAGQSSQSTTYLTFDAPVRLPGVGLGTGTYIFELAAPLSDLRLVRVSSRDRSRVYFTGFTQMIPRPAGVRADRPVSFGEARPGTPTPITAWYPPDRSWGYGFIYDKTERPVNERASR